MSFRKIFKKLSKFVTLSVLPKIVPNKMCEIDPKSYVVDKPLIVILGATGCGKTKLSIELCKYFNGEVISTDSMQIYEGLDIATNKVTPEEAEGIPHHMISYLSPFTFGYTVVPFRNRAVRIINDLHAKGKLPVIVGGTNYYNEAILWKILLSEPDEDETASFSSLPCNYFELLDYLPEGYANLSNEQLHDELKKIDPEEAEVVHPSKRRRVIRCVQYYYKEGRKISDDLRLQRELNGASDLGGPLRFPNTCVLWLQCDKEILLKRLDARVDEMVDRGLERELVDYYDRYFEEYSQKLKEFNLDVNDGWTKGVFQCIGIKEFSEFLQLSVANRQTDKGREIFRKCVTLLKISTRQYANQQTRFIRNRFLRKDRIAPGVFALNATDVQIWKKNVLKPAISIFEGYLIGKPNELYHPLLAEAEKHDRIVRTCELCNITVEDENQWLVHNKSKRHKANVSKRKLEEAKIGENCKNEEIDEPATKKLKDNDNLEDVVDDSENKCERAAN